MDYSANIASQLEKTVHMVKSKTLTVFRENNFPVSKDQWTILERIAKEEGSNQKDIAKDTFKDPAALTRMLDLLVDKGYVKRQPSASDRRTFDIYLTVEGSRLVKRMTPIVEKINASIEKKITKEEKKKLQLLLEKLN